jgi:hypothetical protein
VLIGTQTGYTPAVFSALGGGIQSASVRFTLYDGDNAPGDFDATDNTLLLNGTSFGNWTSIATQETSGDGLTSFGSGFGFADGTLSTGFFTNTDVVSLANLYTSLSSGSLAFSLADVDPYDNFYDFTLGVDGGLINVGQGPVVTPPSSVPEPATWAMFIGGFGLIGSAMRRRQRTAVRFA